MSQTRAISIISRLFISQPIFENRGDARIHLARRAPQGGPDSAALSIAQVVEFLKECVTVMEITNRNEVEITVSPSRKRAYLIGILVILLSEFLVRNIFLPERASDIHLSMALAIEWLIFIMLLAFWIPKVEKQSLKSIGLGKFKWRHLWVGIGTYLLAFVAAIFSGLALEAAGLEPIRSLQPMIKNYHGLTLLGLFITGTLVEEVFYRGYLIERLSTLTGRRWLAAIISWFLFSLVHLKFFGLGPTIDVSVLAAVLVLLYLKEGSLWPCIVLHGLNGVFAYLVFPLLV